MLRNARDAGARRIYVATAREGNARTITMLDDGSGIPRDLWDAIFDARVTSKLESVHMDRWGVHGRGMALFSIRENVVSAHVADSVVGGGSSIHITTDTTSLTERADQSTWPTVARDEEGHLAVERGPHNMIRACCEFGLEERWSCEVFFGSAAEIVATARMRVKTSLRNTDLLFLDDLSTVAMVQAGFGICIMPELVMTDIPYNVRSYRMDPDAARIIGLAVRGPGQMAPAARTLYRHILEKYRNI
jgi:hypothetical protein